ncbi:MAG: DUF86 domain-containing protein [Rhodocyclales bacterium]|nr:DUF86 domain-containing protein [Rhodocyclales bacterium]
MPRDWRLFLGDMAEACLKIVEYRQSIDRTEFDRRSMAFDAIVRNVEILGEAAGKLPIEVRQLAPEIPWDAIVGMRHRIGHAYFGVDDDILWDVVENEVPLLVKAIERLRTARIK